MLWKENPSLRSGVMWPDVNHPTTMDHFHLTAHLQVFYSSYTAVMLIANDYEFLFIAHVVHKFITLFVITFSVAERPGDKLVPVITR